MSNKLRGALFAPLTMAISRKGMLSAQTVLTENFPQSAIRNPQSAEGRFGLRPIIQSPSFGTRARESSRQKWSSSLFAKMPDAKRLNQTSTASPARTRSEEHTSELQSPYDLVCRLLLEKKKKITKHI